MGKKPLYFEKHPMPFPATCEYRGYVIDVTDGDTFVAILDLGCFEYVFRSIRLSGIDTSEIFRPKSDDERVHGLLAKSFLESRLLNKPIKVVTNNKSSFERLVAQVFYFEDGVWIDIAEDLFVNNHSKISD